MTSFFVALNPEGEGDGEASLASSLTEDGAPRAAAVKERVLHVSHRELRSESGFWNENARAG